MTTTPAPRAGPALDPSGGIPARGPLRAALATLVADGTLSAPQAEAVLAAVARRQAEPPDALVTPAAPGAEPAPAAGGAERAPWRGRLLEAAVYLGSAFVLAAVGVVVQQRWSGMSRGTQLLLTGGLAAVALAAGLVVGWPARPRRTTRGAAPDASGGGAAEGPGAGAGLVEVAPSGHAVRRRSASVLLTLAAALATATTALLVGEGRWLGVAAAGVAVVAMVGVQVVAPSMLSELALFAAGTALVTAVPDAAMPAPRGEEVAGSFDWEAVDLLRGGLLLGYGIAWAWGASRRLPHREVAVALGLGAGVVGAMSTAAKGEPLAAALLGALAAAAVLTYLRDPAWPWMVGAVGAVFFAVLLVGNRTLGPALTFLVAGLVLLGGTAAAVAVARHRAARGSRDTAVRHPGG